MNIRIRGRRAKSEGSGRAVSGSGIGIGGRGLFTVHPNDVHRLRPGGPLGEAEIVFFTGSARGIR